jgi:Protein of unknown function (DUF3151)
MPPMSQLPIGEPAETRISEPDGSLEALQAAGDPEGLAAVAARFPTCLAAWAALGEEALREGGAVPAYAYFRVGYHRGLDRLRQSGWRGSGYVRWRHETNRGFLRSLDGLRHTAEAIGEADEAERCALFLRQLDPDWPPADR